MAKASRAGVPGDDEKPGKKKAAKADRKDKAKSKAASAKADKARGKKGKKTGKAAKAAALPVSPLAPAGFPDLPVVAGAEFAAAKAGVRYGDRPDVALIRLAPGSAVAGVFTRSATRAAPVLDCEAKLAQRGKAATALASAGAAIIVNAGNANAFTGRAGADAVAAITTATAEALDLPAARVFSASTGVIGEPLPHERITAALPGLVTALSPDAAPKAARAIMTTDTFAKGAGATVTLSSGPVHIAGIAKGSGMIAPDMATMLAYVVTDASIPQPALQKLLSRLTDRTFNAITVDGDTSTSDTLMLAATGQGPAVGDLRGTDGRAFVAALEGVLRDLAQQIVRDGEGATKFIEVSVTGAADFTDARRVALAIANSPLVKTAVAGGDANWGRIVMAVGKSGARADRDRLAIFFGDMCLARGGARVAEYDEGAASAYMKRDEIALGVDLGLGKGAATVWTCDLTHGYIAINADYRS